MMPRSWMGFAMDDHRKDRLLLAALGALTALVHIVTARDSYGLFRDELYYLANADHLGFGYVDHPPLVGLLAWLSRGLLGESMTAIRLLPALAGGATVFLAGGLARELGGRAEVHRALPPEDRAAACVLGQNYGQAGAIDFYGRPLGLPPALSGHNSYWLWGPRGCSGEVLIVIGSVQEHLEQRFERVAEGAAYRCADCMPYEADKTIWVCRAPRMLTLVRFCSSM